MTELTPGLVARIDQSISEAQWALDRLLESLARLIENGGATQGFMDFGAYFIDLAKREPVEAGAVASLAILRLYEAQQAAS